MSVLDKFKLDGKVALVSGCYSLDEFYRHRPEYQQLKRLKSQRGNYSYLGFAQLSNP